MYYFKNIITHNNGLHFWNSDGQKESIECNYIVLATGYHLDKQFHGHSQLPNLYKRLLDSNDTTIAYIGFAPSFNWVQVSDLQSRWFSRLIMGKLPSIDNWNAQQDLKKNLQKQALLSYEYQDLAYKAYDYCDELANELNIQAKSKYTFSRWWKVPRFDEWSD